MATGLDGERTIPVAEFFTDFFTTALRPDEIDRNPYPCPSRWQRRSVHQIGTQGRDFAIVGVAAQVTIDATGLCVRAGIGLTNVVLHH